VNDPAYNGHHHHGFSFVRLSSSTAPTSLVIGSSAICFPRRAFVDAYTQAYFSIGMGEASDRYRAAN
jgi:hypothetical protein